MTKNSGSSLGDRNWNSEFTESLDAQTVQQDYSRRDALRALGKFSAFVGTSGVVVLSAEDVVAQSGQTSCKQQCFDYFPPPRGAPFEQCIVGCNNQEKIEQLLNDQ